MTPTQQSIIARREAVQWALDLIEHGHDLGTLHAQLAGELEWLDSCIARHPRRKTIASVVERLRQAGAL